MKNMLYIQSGGPTCVINSSLYGAIREAQRHPDQIDHIYGSQHGIEGLISDDIIDIGQEDDEQIELLLQTPGSILGTTRRKLPKDINDPIYNHIINNLKKYEIKYVFINGGNDTMDTCYKLSVLVKQMGLDIMVIGVPKTIDNDLAGTDHSLGFPSCAKFIVNTVSSLIKDACGFMVGKIHVVEIMGRDAGWLTGAADVLPEGNRPHLFYLPEQSFNLEQFLKDVKAVYDREGFAMVCISEGIQFPRDMSAAHIDGFGHVQLGGAAADLCHIIDSRLHLPTRPVELSLVQRAAPFFISQVDRKEAIKTGELAVQTALRGVTGKMIVFKRTNNHPYRILYELEDLSKIANAVSAVPTSMMHDATRMDESFREYIRPLIKGEVQLKYKDGIALLSNFKRIKVVA